MSPAPLELPPDREQAIGRVARALRRWGSPKAQIFVLLLLTGAIGAGASFVLLAAGLESMALRYPVAAAVAYGAFLLMLRAWAAWQVGQLELAPESGPEEAEALGRRDRRSRLWDLLDGVDVLSWIDDGEVVLLVIAVLVVVAVLVGVVVAAPLLLAEVVLEALLVAGLWRRFERRRADAGSFAALRATWGAAAIVTAALSVIGFLLQRIAPEARSIGEVARGAFG